MHKKLFAALAVLVLILSACSQQSTPVPTASATATLPAGAATPAALSSDCTVVSLMPTQGPTEASLFPPDSPVDWSRGPETAAATFLVYSDFQCPGCALLAPVLAQLQEQYPGDVRIVYRHYPLNIHDKAVLSAQAAEAAGLQGKFWEMHDLLFEGQPLWTGMTLEQFTAWLDTQVSALGLDAARFSADLTSQALVDKIAAARSEGERISLPGTPFLLVNGRIWQGPTDLVNLGNLVQIFKLQSRQFTGCPPMEIDPARQYTATLQTEKGDIVIQLYASQAPTTVNSFVFLARRGWYDGVTFHRVVTNPDVAQAGDPSGTGWGGPGYAFKDEIVEELKFDGPGVVGMANSGSDTNGSQFFITRSAIPTLDGRFTIFGKVIKGLEVLSQLTPRDPSASAILPPGDQILKVTIEEK